MYAYFGATYAVRIVVGPKRLYENDFALTEFFIKKEGGKHYFTLFSSSSLA